MCADSLSISVRHGPGRPAEGGGTEYLKAHYLQKELEKAGLPPAYEGEFFHEFVTDAPQGAEKILKALEEKGYLGGLPLPDGRLLWCTTEKEYERGNG